MSTRRREITLTGKRIVRRRSNISGWGVFAREPITKNSRIIDYAGRKISTEEADRRERSSQKRGEIWCFTINRRWCRDASREGNTARFINHRCRPNCYSQVIGDIIWIRAGRNIRAGEELTYHYNTGGEAGLMCRCRPACKTLL